MISDHVEVSCFFPGSMAKEQLAVGKRGPAVVTGVVRKSGPVKRIMVRTQKGGPNAWKLPLRNTSAHPNCDL